MTPACTTERATLQALFAADQTDWKAYALLKLKHSNQDHSQAKHRLDSAIRQRSAQALAVLRSIGEPALSKIGDDGALALSVLASHDPVILKQVLQAFEALYDKNPQDCRYQSIPAMTDALCMYRYKPQLYGTMWLFDARGWPFLYQVRDVARVNQRRAEYGIEPLRWPKSLAIPASEQPWLQRPFEEHTMRMPTAEERTLNN